MALDELRPGLIENRYFQSLSRGELVPYERRQPSTDRALVVCRVCWTHTKLRAEKIDLVDGRAYQRCPQCDASSLIRWGDAVTLGLADEEVG